MNKITPASDAAFAFKTDWSARALFGLLGGDDFSVKVSPDGVVGQFEIMRSTISVEMTFDDLYLGRVNTIGFAGHMLTRWNE